jgi:hypothetical protein
MVFDPAVNPLVFCLGWPNSTTSLKSAAAVVFTFLFRVSCHFIISHAASAGIPSIFLAASPQAVVASYTTGSDFLACDGCCEQEELVARRVKRNTAVNEYPACFISPVLLKIIQVKLKS